MGTSTFVLICRASGREQVFLICRASGKGTPSEKEGQLRIAFQQSIHQAVYIGINP